MLANACIGGWFRLVRVTTCSPSLNWNATITTPLRIDR
jgi:hypothetical protein